MASHRRSFCVALALGPAEERAGDAVRRQGPKPELPEALIFAAVERGQADTTGEQMTDRTVTAVPGATQLPAARLEPDAISAAQDTIIGMGNSAPTVAIGLSLALLVAASAYGGAPVIVLCGIPMLIIANAYRRLNLWNANCGASFEWGGRPINPYLCFLTGCWMIPGGLVGSRCGR